MWLPEASVSKRRSNEQLVALLEKHRSNPVATSHSIDKPSDSRCGIVEIFIAVLLTVRDFIIQHRNTFDVVRVASRIPWEGGISKYLSLFLFLFFLLLESKFFLYRNDRGNEKFRVTDILPFFFAIPLTNVHNWRLISDGTLSEEY